MASAAYIWVIPDQGAMKGGDLYDRFGNLTYFADTAGLTDKAATAADKQVTVKAHSRASFMRDPAPSNVATSSRSFTTGIRRSKGALPGYTVTFLSDAGLPGEETRQFQFTGTMSALYAWLKTTAKMQVQIFGPTGTPYDPIPAATP
jgi:hypothetical protein